MKAKGVDIFFLVAFMVMLLLPMVFVDPSGGGVSEKENRMLASRPALTDIRKSPTDFTRRFDRWFSDNIGLRESMINLHNHFDGLTTQSHYAEREGLFLLVGQQGHHYFTANGRLTAKFAGKGDLLSDEQLSGLVSRLKEINDFLFKRNIPFIVMFCAEKETVYPEYYPISIIRGPEPVELDRIVEHIKTKAEIDVFSNRQCLLDAKESFLVFDKYYVNRTGITHFNEAGAFFSYQELIKHINKYFPEMLPLPLEDITITYDENEVAAVLLKEPHHRRLDSDFFDNVSLAYSLKPEFTSAFENNDLTLPTALFMRDSNFGIMPPRLRLSRFVPEHFGRTITIHYENMQYFEDYVELYNPDIVIFECAEWQLDVFADYIINTRLLF